MEFQPKYKTDRVFGPSYASVSRAVVMRVGPALVNGTIQEIGEDDSLTIYTAGASAPQGLVGYWYCKSVDDLKNMPDLHWTWPPFVHSPPPENPAITYTGNTA